MDTQSLEAFVAVARQGSFSAAAEDLHLTQPAVSKRIASLEQRLGQRLFDRISRQPRLTEAGRALLPRARRILLDMADAQRALDRLQDTVAGPLQLGISHHLGLHRLPPVLARYTRRHPQVRLDISFQDSERSAERVLSGELEIAVGTLSPRLPDTLSQQPIWRDVLQVAVGPDHPLAGQQQVDLPTLGRHPAIVPGLHTHTGVILTGLFEQAGLALEVGLDTHFLETIKTMVAIGMGWSILPDTLIDDGLHTLQLIDAQGQERHLSRQLGYQIHRERSLSNAALALVEALREAADDFSRDRPVDPHR